MYEALACRVNLLHVYDNLPPYLINEFLLMTHVVGRVTVDDPRPMGTTP